MKSLEEFFFCPLLKPLYFRSKHIDLSIFLHISQVIYVRLIKILLWQFFNYNKMLEPASWIMAIIWRSLFCRKTVVSPCFFLCGVAWNLQNAKRCFYAAVLVGRQTKNSKLVAECWNWLALCQKNLTCQCVNWNRSYPR